MTIHFHREMDTLRKLLLSVGSQVEDQLAKAISALQTRDLDLAEEVIEGDNEIDRLEIEVEETGLKILALYQPVANDLRFIVSALKMNNDLERMGDIVVSIAKRARYLAKRVPIGLPDGLDQMSAEVRMMVQRSLDALIATDIELAAQVCEHDNVVDEMKREIGNGIRDRITEDPENTRVLLKVLDIPRHLERIADLATNIAEDVIYMTEGTIVRHHALEEDEKEVEQER